MYYDTEFKVKDYRKFIDYDRQIKEKYDPCINCPNRTKNRLNICHCTLPHFTNPIFINKGMNNESN